jgi:hypothetical protein
MKATGLLLNGLLIGVVAAFGQKPTEPPIRVLFSLDKSCFCVETHNLTQTAKATQEQVADSIYQG